MTHRDDCGDVAICDKLQGGEEHVADGVNEVIVINWSKLMPSFYFEACLESKHIVGCTRCQF